jgi:hypothetical protein
MQVWRGPKRGSALDMKCTGSKQPNQYIEEWLASAPRDDLVHSNLSGRTRFLSAASFPGVSSCVQNGDTRHLHYPTGDYSHLVREKILLHSSGGVTKSSRGMSSFKMGDSKYSGAGADWTQLLTDPALVSHLGELLQVYREAAPEKRDQALLEAMRNIKGSVPVAKASGAAAAVAPKAQATAPAQPVPAPPVATEPGTTPPFEPDIFTPSWGQDRRRYTRIKCFVAVELHLNNSAVPIWGNLSNTGLGGCFVETATPVPSGVNVEIGLWLANGKIWIKGLILTGIVTKSSPSFGVRIKFTELEPAERENLRHFLKFVESTTKSYNKDNGYLAQLKR